MNQKNGKVFTSKSVGKGPTFFEKKNLPGRILTKVEKHCDVRLTEKCASSSQQMS